MWYLTNINICIKKVVKGMREMVIKMFIIYFLGITMGLILSILKDKLFNLIIKRNKYLKQKQFKEQMENLQIK